MKTHLYPLPAPLKGHYLKGEFRRPSQPTARLELLSPADLSDRIGIYEGSYTEIDEMVEAARQALPAWKKTKLEERAALLTRYRERLIERKADLVQAIMREVGKPLWEAEGEHSAMVGKVEVTLRETPKLTSEFEVPEASPGTLGRCRYRSLGVLAVIGPFNFPGHLANGHIVPALLTGNCVIFKPSEKAPLTGQILTECMHAAGVPPGVFQMLQGDREGSRRLCIHEKIAGILFTGSYEAGLRIKQDTLTQHWKLLALEMGGKNPALILSDADASLASKEVLVSAFATAGQRCSSTSRVLIHRSLADAFVTELHERSKKFKIGHPSTNPFMGPLIDSSSVDRYLKVQTMAQREGFEVLMRGKSLDLEKKGYYVTPSIAFAQSMTPDAAKKGHYQQTEWFCPNVAVVAFDDLEEALELANASQYGLVASVYTKERSVFEKARDTLEYGLVNWNRGTIGASSRLPFGGTKKSGNHRPTALFAPFYCTEPQASLECPGQIDSTAQIPGL